MAASLHGVVRASLDVDAVLLLTVQQATGLEKKLQQAGLATDLRHGDPGDPISPMHARHSQPPPINLSICP
jgi:hypothetical protein